MRTLFIKTEKKSPLTLKCSYAYTTGIFQLLTPNMSLCNGLCLLTQIQISCFVNLCPHWVISGVGNCSVLNSCPQIQIFPFAALNEGLSSFTFLLFLIPLQRNLMLSFLKLFPTNSLKQTWISHSTLAIMNLSIWKL